MGLRCGVVRVLRVSYAPQESPGRFVAMDFRHVGRPAHQLDAFFAPLTKQSSVMKNCNVAGGRQPTFVNHIFGRSRYPSP
jgi:hypothetical protein